MLSTSSMAFSMRNVECLAVAVLLVELPCEKSERVWLSLRTSTGMPSPASVSSDPMKQKSALIVGMLGDGPDVAACALPNALAFTQHSHHGAYSTCWLSTCISICAFVGTGGRRIPLARGRGAGCSSGGGATAALGPGSGAALLRFSGAPATSASRSRSASCSFVSCSSACSPCIAPSRSRLLSAAWAASTPRCAASATNRLAAGGAPASPESMSTSSSSTGSIDIAPLLCGLMVLQPMGRQPAG